MQLLRIGASCHNCSRHLGFRVETPNQAGHVWLGHVPAHVCWDALNCISGMVALCRVAGRLLDAPCQQ